MAGAWSRRHHVALLAGEFGASQQLNAAARLAWLTAVREACEREGIGWALWGYDDVDGLRDAPAGRALGRSGCRRAGGALGSTTCNKR